MKLGGLVTKMDSPVLLVWLCLCLTLVLTGQTANGASKSEGVIEDINVRQLNKFIQEKDNTAIFWYTKNCKPCDSALQQLEKIDDKTDQLGVEFAKINDKRVAKTYNIVEFPILTYFRKGTPEPIVFTGDLENVEAVEEFLTSLQSSPDRIEEVNEKILKKIVAETNFVAVLFYRPDCKKSEKALRELENIDDEADELGIAFVKINDDELADEYNLKNLPALVYYRGQIPIVFDGDLTKEEQVLEWLIQNKSMGDEDEEIEAVSAKALETLIDSIEKLAVLFLDNSPLSASSLKELEHIDDDCGRNGIEFVKTDDKKAAKQHGIDELPTLVYYESRVPNVYDGDLRNEEQVLEWLLHQLQADEIEDVTDVMLDRLILESKYLAVLFYSEDQKESREVLVELENIDDECDSKGINFVKIDDLAEAAEYGIDITPQLVYFENSIPSMYEGNLMKEDEVLAWLIQQTETDEIEDVTDEMLEKLINNNREIAVLFYDKDQRKSQKIILELEQIDQECDKHGIIFVKISDEGKVKELGLQVPALIYFESKVPHLFEGDLSDEDSVLKWLLHQLHADEIEEVTDEMLDQLIEKNPYVAALFYDKDDKQDMQILSSLENIDDECDLNGILFVKIDDDNEAKEYGLENLPVLIYFENKVPSIYEGDLSVEENVLKWLVEQRHTDTIEEVTDEMLEKLVNTHTYVAVYFSGPCDESDADSSCTSILSELESIDDDTDEAGIQMVTTEEQIFGKKIGVKNYPSLVMFRNGDPLFFKGSLTDEDEMLAWLTDDSTLELPDRIEEVNLKMLQRLLDQQEHVVVFFYNAEDKKSQKILQQLENIDDEADNEGMAFVKISDSDMLREYDLNPLPALVYFRAKFPRIYPGDMHKESNVLQWLLQLKKTPTDLIEEVDRRTLRMLLDEMDHVGVFFYEDTCTKLCVDILHDLETIDDEAEEEGIQMVKTTDLTIAEELNIKDFPTLVYYQGGIPSLFKGDLTDEGGVLRWMRMIHTISAGLDAKPTTCLLMKLKEENENTEQEFRCCPATLDVCAGMVKVTPGGKESQSKPAKLYTDLHDEVEGGDGDDVSTKIHGKDKSTKETQKSISPTDTEAGEERRREDVRKRILSTGKLSAGDLENQEEVYAWLVYQRHFEALPELTRSDLDDLIGDSDYLSVLFFSNYSNTACARALRRACIIAEDAAEFGIPIAKMGDPIIAKKYGVRELPGLILFRRGRHIKYDESLEDEEEMLDFLTAPENMILNDQIEVVNSKMLARMRDMTEHLLVLFFSETECKQCERVVTALEEIDDDAADIGVNFVRVDDWALAKSFGVHALPALLYFRMLTQYENFRIECFHTASSTPRLGSDEPVIYAGDLRAPSKILEWIMMRKDPTGVAMAEVNGEALEDLIKLEDSAIVVYFYNKSHCSACEPEKHSRKRKQIDEDPEAEANRLSLCTQCTNILIKLENVDDEVARRGVTFLRTGDLDFASTQGVNEYPALVYFGNGVASVYESLVEAEEDDIRHWIMEHKTDERIEMVTRGMLDQLLIDVHYLAVFFYKQPCRACDTILMELEKIDDDCDMFGISMVKINDPALAKRYGITSFPALLFFRNGNPLLFEGDMKDEESVLEWLTDDNNRELDDEIESVNQKMLERLVDKSPFLAVFFYDDKDCGDECEGMLASLETVDDEADEFGIDMVKVPEGDVAQDFGIMNVPTLAYFRRGTALIYEGDLFDPNQIIAWLTSNDAFQLPGEIEEVNRRMLEKLLDDNDYVCVYFYEEECSKCEEILEELERIDSETDNLDILFVRIKDAKYAKKWGVSKLPAIVYFRRKFPSIYRGDLSDELVILEWLQKNRYKQPELNLFMFSLASLSLAFIIYTVFILVCLKD